MTLPNQGQPFGSIPYGGLSEFASNNLDDFLLELLGTVISRAAQMANPLAAIQQFANEAGVPQLAELLISALGSSVGLIVLEFLQSIVNAVLNGDVSNVPIIGDLVRALTGGAGGSVDDVAAWFTNFANLDVTALISALTGGSILISDLINTVFTQSLLQNPTQIPFPLSFPIDFGELAATPLQLFAQNLSRILSGDFAGLPLTDTQFNIIPAATSIVEEALIPTGRVAELIDDVLPDIQAPKIITDTIISIVNAMDAGFYSNIITNNIQITVDDVFDVLSVSSDLNFFTQAANLIQYEWNLANQVAGGLFIF